MNAETRLEEGLRRQRERTPEQEAALAGADTAIAGTHELLRFTREGPGSADSPWADPFGADPIVALADATRLAIVAQGGPRDGDELALLASLHAYLDHEDAAHDTDARLNEYGNVPNFGTAIPS